MIDPTYKIFLNLQKKLEERPKVFGVKIASCVVYKNKIISIGFNRKKSSPFQAQYSNHIDRIWIHSEIDAISKSLKHLDLKDLARASLLICRVKSLIIPEGQNLFQWGLAKPCSGCQSCIAAFNIKKVLYSTESNPFYTTL